MVAFIAFLIYGVLTESFETSEQTSDWRSMIIYYICSKFNQLLLRYFRIGIRFRTCDDYCSDVAVAFDDDSHWLRWFQNESSIKYVNCKLYNNIQ